MVLAAVMLLGLSLGCHSKGRETSGATEARPMGEAAETTTDTGAEFDERAEVLGPFLAAHWRLPVPAQGPPPPTWSPLEGSLAPSDCGACHPVQLEQWRTSLHAGAYSPGFSGQLLEGPLADPLEVRQCQTCHAPLAEQQPHDASEAASTAYDPALREEGIVCAACHVRAQQRFGPPRRPELPRLADEVPHGGFEARAEFTQSRFCAECHQFFDDPGVNGKPIQNTYAEWLASPAAAEGRTCQSCHMPDRAHLWRGIHDREMVRSAVDVDLRMETSGDALRAALVLHSRDVGHALPTYVTPRVILAVWQEDASGRQIAGSRAEAIVGREVDFGTWQEVFDTRIPPGGSHTLEYQEERRPSAVAVVGEVRVDPDFHYRDVFASLADGYQSLEARRRMEEAHRRTLESPYVLEELRVPLTEASADSPPERAATAAP